MLRDKMIQIMSAHGRPFFQAAFDREIRCDKCGYWSVQTRLDSPGSCLNVNLPDDFDTLPDFFCALWKSK